MGFLAFILSRVEKFMPTIYMNKKVNSIKPLKGEDVVWKYATMQVLRDLHYQPQQLTHVLYTQFVYR